MEERRKNLIRQFFLMNAGVVAVAAAFVLIAFLNLPIFDCVSYRFFHLYCPLCGGTRAIFALLELDVIGALRYNSFIFYLAFAAIFYDVKVCVGAFHGRADAFAMPKWLIWLTAVLFALFLVGRNLMMIAWGVDPIGDLVGYWR